MKINLGKFFRSLFHDVDLGAVFTAILRDELVGEDPLPDHLEINRIKTIRLFGIVWAVDVTFRRTAEPARLRVEGEAA